MSPSSRSRTHQVDLMAPSPRHRLLALARSDLDVWNRNLARCQVEVAMLKRAIAALEEGGDAEKSFGAEAAGPGSSFSGEPALVSTAPDYSHIPEKGKLSEVVRELASKFLREAGRPLSRVELLERLQAVGIRIEGGNPPKKVGRIMWEARATFENQGAGYWFRGEDVPQV